MPTDRTPAILVKGPTVTASANLGAAGVRVKAEPLFEHIPSDAAGGFGIAGPGGQWQRLTLEEGDDANIWDLCHDLTKPGFGVRGGGGAGAAFAEPDLWQEWMHPMPPVDFGAAASCKPAEPQRTNFPRDPSSNTWFRNTGHSGFDAAAGANGQGARIAHVDTGYDGRHSTKPAHTRRDLEKNFVDRDFPNDASDRSDGLWVQDGHGTGTLGILASPGYGGAPGAEVVSIRVADRVVLFRNSAIAKAFDYIYGLRNDPSTRIDVITMSMGGVASQAWAEAINHLYEAGVFIVTAAGNNQGNLPTRNIVFPARFQRVVAASGIMWDGSPYADLGLDRMAGNYGPDSKMRTTLAASTPNIPWAVGGCEDIVNFSGQGTSCATPQIAAAAALWIAKNRAKLDAYPQGWMKVEAVRKALFDSAELHPNIRDRIGVGALQADGALGLGPAAASALRQEDRANAAFPILRLFTGLGAAAPDPSAQAMLELEALQLSQSHEVEELLPDPDAPPSSIAPATLRKIAEALAARPEASKTLKEALRVADPRTVSPPARSSAAEAIAQMHLARAIDPPVRAPATRRLKVYAYDPSQSSSQDMAIVNLTRIETPWESDLQAGPVGEYLEVVDVDPVSGCAYAPVDLNHPHLLSQDGLSPTTASPQFHQQMVYAVAMKTIGHFERALGRRALWSARKIEGYKEAFVRRLRVYPHAFRGENAYYSSEKKALLFGYFSSVGDDWRSSQSGQLVFSCLSHDIIAHETTHALLDGLHPRYREATNPDVLAFHEAFSDLVALFQHFTLPDAVAHQIARVRGDLTKSNPLVQLAIEFGRATSKHGNFQEALREAVDGLSDKDLEDLKGAAPALPTEVHDRGALLVAAVFDAFLQLYQDRAEEVINLATGGSGVLPAGHLSQPLVQALAKEASKVAGHLMNICIRALDYCPPVDVTFGDYLRAMITADRDLVPDDPRGYRRAILGGFTKRGIYPENVKHLSPDTTVWEMPPIPLNVGDLLDEMDLGWDEKGDREQAWETSRHNAVKLHDWLAYKASDAELEALGLFRKGGPLTVDGQKGRLGGIEVHSVRPARRTGPDGQTRSDLVVEVTQTWTAPDKTKYRGGCTILFDLETWEARYLVRKRVAHEGRIKAQQQDHAMALGETLRDAYFSAVGQPEPFAMLHRGY